MLSNVIHVMWLDGRDKNIEIWSNLRAFHDKYHVAPINTINNFLSRSKEPFRNDICIVSRLPIEFGKTDKKGEN